MTDLPGDFTELHDDLRGVARDLLGRVGAGGDGDPAAADWSLLAESGWLGLDVAEDLDGGGATFAEVAVILHEMGRAATLSPYLGSVVLGAGALALLAPGPGRDELMRDVVTGRCTVAVALPTGDDESLAFRVDRSGGDTRVHGEAAFVPDGAEADRLLLLGLDGEGTPVVVQVAPADPGMRVSATPVLDATRRFALVTADRVAVDAGCVWQFAGDADAAVRRLLDRGALAVACDSLGLAEAMLEATVAYAQTREQFGRPIGSFQAVKHACADLLVALTVGRELLTAALQALVTNDPDAGTAVSMAKSFICAAAVDAAGKAMQLHGGMGYTWESGVHVYLKRAALDRSLFGSPAHHRARFARRFG